MHIYRSMTEAAAGTKDASSIVIIGNFDGVHKGHQTLLNHASSLAITKHLGAKVTPLTFWPHPIRLFKPDSPPFELTTLEERFKLLSLHGADAVAALPFDLEMSKLSPEAFARQVLKGALSATHVIVGEGFHFGHKRAGTTKTLRELGKALGFETTIHEPVVDDKGLVISSTRVRNHLAKGEFVRAKALLTRWWHIEGPVVHGDARGRNLGYPTANVSAIHPVLCPDGIFATTLYSETFGLLKAVTYVGKRPTYEEDGARNVETFVIDWDPKVQGPLDLYEHEVKIAFEEMIRPDQSFESDEALIAQMDLDLAAARRWHGMADA